MLGLPVGIKETLESNMNICAIAPLAAAAIVTATMRIVTATMRRGVSLLLAALAALTGVGVFTASAQEDPTNIVADQIRAQGFKCDSPQSAKRDGQASKPDEPVWILQCESGSYRVRLIPDMAAKVEPLDKSQDGNK